MDDISKRLRMAQRAGQHFGGERDLYEVLGYPREVSIHLMAEMYQRGDIAARIVDAYPDATWRHPPEVLGSIEKEWGALESEFSLWRILHRLDRLTNLGHYGVLLLGLDGGEALSEPARRKDYKLLYAQPHSERSAQIIRWDDDPRSPRYGMPETYRITTGVNWTGSGASKRDITVHHSRVIHVAERALEDPAIGTPRLMKVINRLMDLDKLAGGSAEMYWQNVSMLLAFIADGEAAQQWSPDDKKEMGDQLDQLMHGLRRSIRLQDVTPQQLAPGLQGADPSPHIDKIMDLVSGASGIPKRILIGNEAGELASTQDENSWEARVDERKIQHAKPSLVEALIRRGQSLGFVPRGEFEIDWPESSTMSEEKRADIADKKASAIQKYTGALGAEEVISREEFREWLGQEGAAPDTPAPDTVDEDDPEVVANFNDWKNRRG